MTYIKGILKYTFQNVEIVCMNIHEGCTSYSCFEEGLTMYVSLVCFTYFSHFYNIFFFFFNIIALLVPLQPRSRQSHPLCGSKSRKVPQRSSRKLLAGVHLPKQQLSLHPWSFFCCNNWKILFSQVKNSGPGFCLGICQSMDAHHAFRKRYCWCFMK